MAPVGTYPGLPPAPWVFRSTAAGYVVTDAQGEVVLLIPFDRDQARATIIADFVCDARDAA